MSSQIEVRWLLLLPLGSILFFVSWVFWNLSREIWAEKRRWIRNYRESAGKIYVAHAPSATLSPSRSQYSRDAS